MMTLSLVANLATIQVDYTNAFAQADLHEDVYIEVPTGFSSRDSIKDTVL
jgi:hypothetical protein